MAIPLSKVSVGLVTFEVEALCQTEWQKSRWRILLFYKLFKTLKVKNEIEFEEAFNVPS
jgi:hypothetical protein